MEGLKHVDDIKALKYYQSNAGITQEDVERLQSYYSFINTMQNSWGQPHVVHLLDYAKLSDKQFEGYMMGHDKNNIIEYDNDIAAKHTLNSPLRTLMGGAPSATTTTSNTSNTHGKASSSNPKLKKSFDAFDILDDITKWKEWSKEFLKILSLMGVENAIDPAYNPSNDIEREKLKDDKTFVSTVLGRS